PAQRGGARSPTRVSSPHDLIRDRVSSMLRSALLNVMIGAARKAARSLKRDFGEVEHLQVSLKGPANFVTAADRRAEEILRAERGKGAFLNDKRLRVAARKRLAEAVVACGLPHLGRGDLALFRKEFAAVQEKVAGLRRFGSAALDLAWVAAGRLDAYWERDL